MDVALTLKILILIIGFYMAWNIGANDVSNAMGTSVGSGALTIGKAVILASIFEFSGAFFLGANVSETMQKGLIDTTLFAQDPTTLIIGMCAALLGTSVWLQIASFFGWPVSTTHAIVGAILGFGGLIGGYEAIAWKETSLIAFSWILSPGLSGLLSYAIFHLLQQKILFAISPIDASKKFMPVFTGIVFGTFSISLITNGLKNLHISLSALEVIFISLSVAILGWAATHLYLRKAKFARTACHLVSPYTLISLDKAMKHLQRVELSSYRHTHDQIRKILEEVRAISSHLKEGSGLSAHTSDYQVVEKMFVLLQIFSACFVAFAHGANDVANAIGPVAAVLDMVKNGATTQIAPVPIWLLAVGGLGIVIGLSTWGWRVIQTIGKKITELTPTRGFCAEFGAATIILIASKMGLPISTTHCLVGAVLGVGLARGIRAINLSILKDIVLSWIITLPASALMSILFYYLIKALVM